MKSVSGDKGSESEGKVEGGLPPHCPVLKFTATMGSPSSHPHGEWRSHTVLFEIEGAGWLLASRPCQDSSRTFFSPAKSTLSL